MYKFTKILTLASVFFLCIATMSCKKEDDESPAADLTSEAVGNYKATKISYDGDSEDVSGMGYAVEVIKVKENLVTLKLDVGIDFEIEDVELKGKSGAITFAKNQDGETLDGTIAGNKITLTTTAISMKIIVEGEK